MNSRKQKKVATEQEVLAVATLVESRDYRGAIVLLEFRPTHDDMTMLWLAYSAFHLGDYNRALGVYTTISAHLDTKTTVDVSLYMNCCLFFLGLFKDSGETTRCHSENTLQNRLLLHAAYQERDNHQLKEQRRQLSELRKDRLSLASVLHQSSQFQDALDIYKSEFADHAELKALGVYIASCYYHLDQFDTSLQFLAPYLAAYPLSPSAINLKACNQFKLDNAPIAEKHTKHILDLLSDSTHSLSKHLLQHNSVVFRNGQDALLVLPPLLDVIPETRLNLVIYHLHHDKVLEAYELIKNLNPESAQEYVLKAVVHTRMAQGEHSDDTHHLELASQYFQTVGSSADKCDTVIGRQCMASHLILFEQFEDAVTYLQSIISHADSTPAFLWNFGLALAGAGRFKAAEAALTRIDDERLRSTYVFQSWLVRCYIMNGKDHEVWDLYTRIKPGSEDKALLLLIANDSYKVGSYFSSAQAFDLLEREGVTDNWEGKRGACCGVLQQVIAQQEPPSRLSDVVAMLQKNVATKREAGEIIGFMNNWAHANGVQL